MIRNTYRTVLSAALAALVIAGCKVETTTNPEPQPQPQPQPEPAKEPEKNYPEPPAPSDPRPVNFPELQRAELPNKLAIYVVENHEVPIVDIQLVVRVGDVHDEMLATMTASMLGEGTKKRTKAQIDAEIEQLGSSLGASSSTHTTVISTRVLRPNLDKALALIDDMVENPAFAQEALDKLKEQQKVALKSAKSNGQELGRTLLGMKLYPEGHPYGRGFMTEAEIDAVSIDMLKGFHSTWFKANNAHIILSGDITVKDAEKAVSKAMKMWQPAKAAPSPTKMAAGDAAATTSASLFPPNPLEKFQAADYEKARPTELVVNVVDRKSPSVEIFFGNLSLARNHPDWVSFEVLNRILGAGIGSRLFQDIRETRKLTYNVGSTAVPNKVVGAFVIATQTKKVPEMVTALFAQIDRIRNEDPPKEEFEAARNGLSRSFPLQIETATQVAGRVATSLTYGLPEDYWRVYRDKIDATQLEDIKKLARKHISDLPVIVMVGRANKIQDMIKETPELKNAKVIVYDSDLKPKG
jgi:zinc protease